MLGLINCQIGEVVRFHDYLHGFRAGRSIGTNSLEVKLTVMREEVLYEFFIELKKAYNEQDQ